MIRRKTLLAAIPCLYKTKQASFPKKRSRMASNDDNNVGGPPVIRNDDADQLSFKDQARNCTSRPNKQSPTNNRLPRQTHRAPSVTPDTPLVEIGPAEVVAVNETNPVPTGNAATPERNPSTGWKWPVTIIVSVFLLVGGGAAVGIVFALKNSSDSAPEPMTIPAQRPTRLPTSSATIEPTSSPTAPNRAIADGTELLTAIDSYLAGSSTLHYGSTINDWDVSRVKSFQRAFYKGRNEAVSSFNDDISKWNVSSAETMTEMFEGANSFNINISAWDVSSVTEMVWMFSATAFNQDISSWNVGSVVDMTGLFYETRFNQDISGWNVSSVNTTASMFWLAIEFNQNIATWDVSNLKDASFMFAGARSFDQDLCPWTTKIPIDADVRGMFSGTDAITVIAGPARACPSQEDPDLPNGPMCHICMS